MSSWFCWRDTLFVRALSLSHIKNFIHSRGPESLARLGENQMKIVMHCDFRICIMKTIFRKGQKTENDFGLQLNYLKPSCISNFQTIVVFFRHLHHEDSFRKDLWPITQIFKTMYVKFTPNHCLL